MNDMRLGRSLESTLSCCDGLLGVDLVCAEGLLSRDSSAGWAGNSLMCSGSRRTRLPNGAIVGVRRVVCCWMLRKKAKGKRQSRAENVTWYSAAGVMMAGEKK